jgi:hypothetical protein
MNQFLVISMSKMVKLLLIFFIFFERRSILHVKGFKTANTIILKG